MFTGIIREMGTITAIAREEARQDPFNGVLLTITSSSAATLVPGDSMAVNGVCLTVLSHTNDTWQARLMAETLQRTNLGALTIGSLVNLERPLAVGQTLDGHFVQGHVDARCQVTAIASAGDDKIFTFLPPPALLPYIVPKGSVALDGVSLTVVALTDDSFTISFMPYTLEHTTFGTATEGYQANLEVDMLGKYVASLLRHHTQPARV